MLDIRKGSSSLMCFVVLGAFFASLVPLAVGAANVVPTLVKFSGTLTPTVGRGLVGVTFAVYRDQEGGAPLWTETQNVQPDKAGHYTVMLGSTTAAGLPGDLFTSGDARWVGVQPQGQAEQPRVMLLSVPYAMKAGDAATVGGLPPSAFVLAAPGSTTGSSTPGGASASSDSNALSGTGKKNYLPIWTNGTTLGNSVLFQSGKGSTALVGLNTTTPASTLDVNGTGTIRGLFTLPTTGTATSSSGFNSQPQDLSTSVFNSSTNTAVTQTFQWQAEPVGNDTSSATGSLNLLFGQGSGNLAETGLNIASNGQINFAQGQTFPGTGNGTITGVAAGTALTGGGNSGNVTLNVDTTKVLTGVMAGTDLTGGGTGGAQTLNLDTTKVPQLGSNDSFTGSVGVGAPANPNGWTPLTLGGANSFGTWVTLANTSSGGHTWNILSAGSGNSEGAGNLGITDFTGASTIYLEGNTNTASLTASGAVNGAVLNATSNFNLAGVPFAFGSAGNGNALLGFAGAGTPTTTGTYNTAVGKASLFSNVNGSYNVASGLQALAFNSTGSNNTAIGVDALYYNTTGSSNTALGFLAGQNSSQNNLTNTTAIGAYSEVTESNALVLGSINGVNNATANTLVGIGTTAPTQSLEVDLGNSLVRGTNNFQKDGDTANLFMGDTNNFIQSTHGLGITIGVYQQPSAVQINQYSGFVGIGTILPTNRLTLGKGTGVAIGDGWTTYSSRRWKTHIHTLDNALAKVEQLRGVSYDLKESGKHEIGVIAEEVGQVVPEVVSYEENGKDARGVDYTRLTALLIEAVKQQQRQIRTQQGQIRVQQQQIARLNNTAGILRGASPAGNGRRTASAANALAPTSFDKTKDQELSTVRRQLNQLRDKDARLEARLARLEHALNAPGQQATVIAMASPKR